MLYLRAVGTLAASGRGGARDPDRPAGRAGGPLVVHGARGTPRPARRTLASKRRGGRGAAWLARRVDVYVRLIEVGRPVLQVSPRGPMAHGFAPFHLPLVVGLPICNLTGVGIMGPVGIGQVSFVVRDDGPGRTRGGGAGFGPNVTQRGVTITPL